MRKFQFYKLQASGNDFILIENPKLQIPNSKLKKFARKCCKRRFGLGGDGLLVIEPSRKADFKMRIFNPDGSQPKMCGNGARCVALWASRKSPGTRHHLRFETKAGIVESKVKLKRSKEKDCADVAIRIVDPFDLKLVLPLKVGGRDLKVNFINTGVPHAVIFVHGLNKIDVEGIGRSIRFHKEFEPEGTNVDFVEFLRSNFISIRTYERGVEAETLACGTGVAASAIISWFFAHGSWTVGKKIVKVKVRSGDVLKVFFNLKQEKVEGVWIEGKAYLVYKGQISLKV